MYCIRANVSRKVECGPEDKLTGIQTGVHKYSQLNCRKWIETCLDVQGYFETDFNDCGVRCGGQGIFFSNLISVGFLCCDWKLECKYVWGKLVQDPESLYIS